jgi:hypothetical protein
VDTAASIGRGFWTMKAPAALLPVILAGMACMVCMVLPFGAVTTPDSAAYLATARSLLETGRLVNYDGYPYVLWPPLYPIALAASGWLVPLDTRGAPVLLGLLLYAGTLLLFQGLLRRLIDSPVVRGLGFLLVASASTLLLYMSALLSEGLFIFLTVAFFHVLIRDDLPLERQVLLLSTIAALATLTRYIGVALYPLLAVVFLLRGGLTGWNRRRWLAIAGCGLTMLPLAAYLFRNIRLTGHLTGARTLPLASWRDNLGAGLDTVGQFLLPSFIPVAIRIAILLLILAGLTALCLRPGKPRLAALALLLWPLGYFSLLLGLASVGYMDRFDFRLMSPLLVPLWLSLAVLGDRLVTRGAPLFRYAVYALMALLLAVSVQRSAKLCVNAQRHGPGLYANREWAEDALSRDILAGRYTGRLYSNAADALYLRTLRPATMLPTRSSGETGEGLLHEGETTYLAWYPDFWRAYTVSPGELDGAVVLTPVEHYERCVVYRVTPRPQPVVDPPVSP